MSSLGPAVATAGRTTVADPSSQCPVSPSVMKPHSAGQCSDPQDSVPSSSEMTQAARAETYDCTGSGTLRVLRTETDGLSLPVSRQDASQSPSSARPGLSPPVRRQNASQSPSSPRPGLSPPVRRQNASQNPSSPRPPAKQGRTGHGCDSKGMKRGSKSSGDLQSDSLACQTKFLVLQFLQESMNGESLLYLSQSSFSNTSESEPRYISHAEKLRQQWQTNRSQSSSPNLQTGHTKSKLKQKLKTSKSCHDLMDKSYRKDVLPQNKPPRTRKRVSSNTGGRDDTSRPASILPRQRAFQTRDEEKLLRSISENTESSDDGTYFSDADDELDLSNDSGQQDSVTSHSFREKLTQCYKQRETKTQKPHHTLKAQTDCVNCKSANLTTEKSARCKMDDECASSIVSLDMINIEQEPVSPTTQFSRVNDYLVQMSQTSAESFHQENSPSVELTDLDLLYLDAAAKELNTQQDDASKTGSDSDIVDEVSLEEGMSDESDLEAKEDVAEDENQAEDVEAACGGVDSDESDQMEGRIGGHSIRADRSQLRLDLSDPQVNTLLIDAVHALQQDIEEEMSSLESEFEEALQTLQSDHSRPCTLNLSRSRSLSPEAAEAVRILARIGDEVQQRHFQDLDRAVSRLLISSCAGFFTYDNFREAAPLALDGDVDKWKQVATLLLYSQRVALHLSRFGRQGLNRVVDYTARMLVDTAADFIIRQGGWSPMLDPSSATPSSPDHPGPVLNPFLGPFTTSTTSTTQPPDNPETHPAPLSSNTPEQSHLVSAEPAVDLRVPEASKPDHSQDIGKEVSGSHPLTMDASGDYIVIDVTKPDSSVSIDDPSLPDNHNTEDAGICVTSAGQESIFMNPSSAGHDPQEGTCVLESHSGVPSLASSMDRVHNIFPIESSAPQHVEQGSLSSTLPTRVTELDERPVHSMTSTNVAEKAEEEGREEEDSREGRSQTVWGWRVRDRSLDRGQQRVQKPNGMGMESEGPISGQRTAESAEAKRYGDGE